MKRGWLGVVAVAAVATGIIAYKQLHAVPAAGVAGNGRPSVLLFADPGEAGEACGCGQLIKLVRATGARGVAVREVAPGSQPALERKYQVTVAPTVLILDERGHVTARFQGEAPEVIAKVRAALVRLEGPTK